MKNKILGMFLTLALITSGTCVGQVSIDANRDAGFFGASFVDGIPLFTINNLGAHTHVPVGQANSDRVNRSVFDFDIAGNVPSGSTVTDVAFEFEVTQQGGTQGMAAVDFSLHRVTTAWDEGTGVGNIGVATGDGVTWADATPSTPWNNLGGDFDAMSSGMVFVDGPDGLAAGEPPITFSITSAKLIQDVQNIVDGNADNFGFLLKAEPEGVMGSAARVTSREGGNPARLIVTFSGSVLIGDVNLDGVVNLLDVAPFVDLISNGIFQAEADINGDGNVNLLDVSGFVELLSGG